MEEKKTIIIAALFACGKSYLNKNNKDYSIVDIEDKIKENNNHSIIYDEPYIEQIKECYGKCDIILIPVKFHLLALLNKYKYSYILVYPENTPNCYKEWERRNIDRGTKRLWDICKKNWIYFLKRLNADLYAKSKYTLKENEYLTDIIDLIYSENKL